MYKDRILISILVVIMGFNLLDVLTDTHLRVPLWHVLEELSITILSVFGAIYIIVNIRQKSAKLKKLHTELSHKDHQLENITSQMKQARQQYSRAIQEQFLAWNLSKSESEVAWFILKGYSFKEIAILRDTQEKTVRQQASSIYTKSAVDGRHTFAAWFMEDFLVTE